MTVISISMRKLEYRRQLPCVSSNPHRPLPQTMQQCAQCSKSAASSSASRLVAAFEIELPSWLQDIHTEGARRSRPPYSARRGHHTRLRHGEKDATSVSRSPGSASGPFVTEAQRHFYTPKKQANHVTRRHIATSARATKEQRTQAQFISRSDSLSENKAKAASTSSAAAATSPVQSEQKRENRDRTVDSPPFQNLSSSSSSPKSQDSDIVKGNKSHLQYLTEEVVQSTDENAKIPKTDEINTLLAYPTLYDPIRKPRHPIVLCHGLYGFDSWGLELLPALK